MTGGPQDVAWTLPPSITDPEHARLTITRLLADGRALDLGEADASAPIHWRGTIPARTSEAFLLSPTPPSTD